MNEKNVVSRNIALALGMICIVLAAGIVGAVTYYAMVVNDKNSQVDTLNSQLEALNSTNQNYVSTRATLTLRGQWLPLPSGELQGVLMSEDKPRPFVSDIFSDSIPADYSNPVLNATLDQIESTSTSYNITGEAYGTLWLEVLTKGLNGPINIWEKGSINVGKLFANGTRLIVHSDNISERFFENISPPFDYNVTMSYIWVLSQPLTMNLGDRLFVNIVIYGKLSGNGACSFGLICSQGDNDIMLVLPITPA